MFSKTLYLLDCTSEGTVKLLSIDSIISSQTVSNNRIANAIPNIYHRCARICEYNTSWDAWCMGNLVLLFSNFKLYDININCQYNIRFNQSSLECFTILFKFKAYILPGSERGGSSLGKLQCLPYASYSKSRSQHIWHDPSLGLRQPMRPHNICTGLQQREICR